MVWVGPVVCLALGAPLWALAAAAALVGVMSALADAFWGTALQKRVPQEMLGRVSSYDLMVSTVLLPVGLAAVGPLSALWGVSRLLWVASVLPAASWGAVLVGVPEVRGKEDSRASREDPTVGY